MAAPFVTIKVRSGRKLMDRIEAACRYLDVTPANFIEYAIEGELRRQEKNQLKEDITLEEIRHNILGVGQSLSLVEEEGGEVINCQLCLKEISWRDDVEGPVLCEDCHSLARGANLTALEQNG